MLASPSLAAAVALVPPAPPSFSRPRGGRYITFSFQVHSDHAPALRSAIDEISNDIGGRLTGSHSFAKEEALTDAAVALGALRSEVFAKVPAGDPFYV